MLLSPPRPQHWKKHFELVSNQRSSGLARMTDFLDAQARFLQAQARKIEIANDLQDAIQALREMTGILPDSLIALGNELQLIKPDPYVADSWLDLAAQQNPLVLAKRSAVAVSLQEVRPSAWWSLPDFRFNHDPE